MSFKQRYKVKISGTICLTEDDPEFQKVIVLPTYPNSLRNENGFKKLRKEVIEEYSYQAFTPPSIEQLKSFIAMNPVCELEFLMDFDIVRSDNEVIIIAEDRYNAVLFENERRDNLPSHLPLSVFNYGVYCFKLLPANICALRIAAPTS